MMKQVITHVLTCAEDKTTPMTEAQYLLINSLLERRHVRMITAARIIDLLSSEHEHDNGLQLIKSILKPT
jgi:hypothetical protein